jgi:hypothetical protein
MGVSCRVATQLPAGQRWTRLLPFAAVLSMPWRRSRSSLPLRWTVPVGGGFGRLTRFGKLPVNLQTQAFYNVVKPGDAATADWTLRLQVQFLFPNDRTARAEGEPS